MRQVTGIWSVSGHASEEPGAKNVGIVDAAFALDRFASRQRSVADANILAGFNPAQFVENKLRHAARDFEVSRLTHGLVSVKKRVADQARPHYGRHSGRNSSPTGLVIKVITPAMTLESRTAILQEPIQTESHLVQVFLLFMSQIQAQITLREEANP